MRCLRTYVRIKMDPVLAQEALRSFSAEGVSQADVTDRLGISRIKSFRG